MSKKSLYQSGGTAMKSNSTKILVLICALGLVFSATPLRAQVSGATLSGTITDAQGGAVVGAKISAKNGATSVTTESTTNSSGAFSIVNLIPANYDVSVSAAGFRPDDRVRRLPLEEQEARAVLRVGRHRAGRQHHDQATGGEERRSRHQHG